MVLCAVRRDDNGQTAFHWATFLGMPEIMDDIAAEFKIQAARDADNMRRASQEAGVEIDGNPDVPNLHTLQARNSVMLCRTNFDTR